MMSFCVYQEPSYFGTRKNLLCFLTLDVVSLSCRPPTKMIEEAIVGVQEEVFVSNLFNYLHITINALELLSNLPSSPVVNS